MPCLEELEHLHDLLSQIVSDLNIAFLQPCSSMPCDQVLAAVLETCN